MKKIITALFTFGCLACSGFNNQINLLQPAVNMTIEVAAPSYPTGLEYVVYIPSNIGFGAVWFLSFFNEEGINILDINMYYKIPFKDISENFYFYITGGVSTYDGTVDNKEGYFMHEGQGGNIGGGAVFTLHSFDVDYYHKAIATAGLFIKYYQFQDSTDEFDYDSSNTYNPSGFFLGFQIGVNF